MRTNRKTVYPSTRKFDYNVKNFLSGINTIFDEELLEPGVAIESYNFDFSFLC